MKLWGAGVLALVMAMSGEACAQQASMAPMSCDALKSLSIPDVKITSATAQTSQTPACRVVGVIGKEINFFVVLPEQWNGKFVMGGQGGFAGTADESQALALGALGKGYAVAGTDTGHKAGGVDGSWALGEMERIVNYAHLAIHRVTQTSRGIVAARYGKPAEKSYFAGCSNGGREALMSAQRYPNDFDGIIAGAPALNFQGITATFVTITQKMYPDPNKLDKPVLDKPQRDLLAKAVLEACDASDGLKDGVLADPRTCKFDAKTLACAKGKTEGCLTPPQLAAVDAIRNGPQMGGKPFHVGYPWGGEVSDAGWGTWLAGRKDGVGKDRPSLAYGFGGDFMRYFVKQDPNWSYLDFSIVKLPTDMKLIQATVSPTNPDLSAFRAHGGKLLMYHGWSDPALSPLMSTGYVDKVYETDAAAKNDVKLFMMPGVLHCGGGPGPDKLDSLDALDKWVNGGPAPDELPVGFTAGGSRKLCAYPKNAKFKGSGDGKSPDQFTCE